jgi:hypothetical protein
MDSDKSARFSKIIPDTFDMTRDPNTGNISIRRICFTTGILNLFEINNYYLVRRGDCRPQLQLV